MFEGAERLASLGSVPALDTKSNIRPLSQLVEGRVGLIALAASRSGMRIS
jgi:hypothetical protein